MECRYQGYVAGRIGRNGSLDFDFERHTIANFVHLQKYEILPQIASQTRIFNSSSTWLLFYSVHGPVLKMISEKNISAAQSYKITQNEIGLKFSIELSITGKLLPKISNQKCNDYLKLIALQVGIDKPLTHHTARHTYATYMLSRNVSPQALQTLLGHSNLRETMIYAKITPNYLLSEVEKGNFQPLHN